MTQLITTRLSLLYGDKKGVTMLEYGLIAALIAVVAVTALGTLGTNISTQLSSVANTIGK